MERILVNLRLANASNEYDLEIPAFVPVQELAPYVAQALSRVGVGMIPEGPHSLKLASSGNPLLGNHSLADQHVWDGAYLVLHGAQPAYLESTSSGRRYALNKGEMRIGRRAAETPESELASLVDLAYENKGATVSRNHAVIRLQPQTGTWLLIPGSLAQNATHINGKQVQPGQPYTLRNNVLIRVGHVELRFVMGRVT